MIGRALLLFTLLVGGVHAADDWVDRVDEALTWSGKDDRARGRISGLFDLEQYALPQPAPGVISSDAASLLVPRLSLFFDGQLGGHLYAFAQARLDRGFDPSDDRLRARLDEYALRWSVGQAGCLDVQVGKFGTVVGNWVARHDSWTNPFITAPLPYENLTGLWDNEPARSADQLLVWSHVRPGLPSPVVVEEKYLRIPIIWGPSYGTGAAVAGAVGRFRYAFEVKNASLSSRPDTWSANAARWDAPTLSGRVRYVPSEQWEFGWSVSSGSFLRPSAAPLLDPSLSRSRYREIVLGEDLTYAWHHLQVWAEIYAARFQIPLVGNADTLAYYIESRYRFTPFFSAALRWSQQLYGTVDAGGLAVPWGKDVWQIDAAPAWRVTAHAQIKLQYSVQQSPHAAGELSQMVAVQGTVRF